MVKVNEAPWDRSVRVVLALAMLYLAIGGSLSGAAAVIVGILGVVFLLTGLVGFCPLYTLFKFSTKK